jgi:hypothetical protein
MSGGDGGDDDPKKPWFPRNNLKKIVLKYGENSNSHLAWMIRRSCYLKVDFFHAIYKTTGQIRDISFFCPDHLKSNNFQK